MDRRDPPHDSDASTSSESDESGLSGFEDEVVDEEEETGSDSSFFRSSSGSNSSSNGSPTTRQRVDAQIRHRPVATPRVRCPFPNEETERLFHRCLETSSQQHILPPGFGLLEGEEGYGDFNPERQIPVGRTRAKWTHVTLPQNIWEPRIVLWAQAVAGMTQLLGDLGIAT